MRKYQEDDTVDLQEILKRIDEIDDRLKRLEDLRLPRKSKLKPPKPPFLDEKPVRAFMAEKGWNQSDLARELKVGKYLVSVWLSGKNRPSPKNWALLQQLVDVV